MPVSLRVDAHDYGNLSRALKSYDKTLQKQLRKEIGAAVRPVVKKARQQILDASGVPTPFRTAAARKVRLVQRDSPKRTEVAIVAPAAGGEFPDAHRKLNQTGQFRHPVYADQRKGRGQWRWVSQSGPKDWFDGPFREAQHGLRVAVDRAMKNAVAEVEARVR